MKNFIFILILIASAQVFAENENEKFEAYAQANAKKEEAEYKKNPQKDWTYVNAQLVLEKAKLSYEYEVSYNSKKANSRLGIEYSYIATYKDKRNSTLCKIEMLGMKLDRDYTAHNLQCLKSDGTVVFEHSYINLFREEPANYY